jgi:hypothetical protein
MHEADYFDLEFLEILVDLGYADDPPPSRPSPMPYIVPFRSPMARTVAQPAEVRSFECVGSDALPHSSEMHSRNSVSRQNEVSRSVRTPNGVTGAFLLAPKIHSRNPLGDISCFLTSSLLTDLRKNPFSKTPVTLVPDTASGRSQTARTRGSPDSTRIHHLFSSRLARRHRHITRWRESPPLNLPRILIFENSIRTWDANVRTASGSDLVQIAASYTLGRNHLSEPRAVATGFNLRHRDILGIGTQTCQYHLR